MKRYNRGFLKWGPMEHHKDGEWVNYTEASTFYHNVIEQYLHVVKNHSKKNRLLSDENQRLVERNNWLTFIAVVAIFADIVLAFTK